MNLIVWIKFIETITLRCCFMYKFNNAWKLNLLFLQFEQVMSDSAQTKGNLLFYLKKLHSLTKRLVFVRKYGLVVRWKPKGVYVTYTLFSFLFLGLMLPINASPLYYFIHQKIIRSSIVVFLPVLVFPCRSVLLLFVSINIILEWDNDETIDTNLDGTRIADDLTTGEIATSISVAVNTRIAATMVQLFRRL